MSAKKKFPSSELSAQARWLENPKKFSFRLKDIKRIWFAWALLAAGLLLTCAAVLYVKKGVEASSRKEFIFASNEIKNRISTRLQQHAQILRSGSSLFEVTGNISREQWRNSIAHQNIEQILPGIQGIGYSVIIPSDQLTRHEQKIRTEGFPSYSVRPAGKREIYTSIIYLEPFLGRNLRAFGYDMFSEPIRRKAMEHARDFDEATLSGKITLVQETDKDVQAGTLMYVPVYGKGMPAGTVEQRRAAIQGWVYSPYRMNDLMRGILGGWELGEGRQLRLEVFDDTSFLSKALLYDSKPGSKQDAVSNSSFIERASIEFNSHLWILRFTQVDSSSAGVDYSKAWYVLTGGTVVTCLIFVLILLLIDTRYRAKTMAEALTRDLRESEEKYRIIFNNEIYAVCIFDLQSLQLLDVNEAYCRMYGYGKDTLLSGMTIHDITAEHQTSDAAAAQAAHEGTIFIPLRYHKKQDGTVFPVEIVGGPYVWMGRSVMFALAHDITDRMRTEEALRMVSEQFRSVLESAQDVIAMMDTEYRYILFNSAFHNEFKKIFGRDLAIGDSMPQALAQLPDDLGDALKHWKRALAGEDFTITQQFGDAALERHWYELHFSPIRDGNGKVVSAVHVVRNVTERKRAEDELRENEEKFRLLHESAGIGIGYYTEDGTVISYNRLAAMHMNGVPEDFAGKSIYELFSREGAEFYHQRIKKAASSDQPAVYEDTVELPIGSKYFLSTFSRITDRRGKILGVQIISQDITERKQMEEELRKSKEEYQGYFEMGSIGMCVTSPEKGWGEVNDRLCQMLGYAKKELSQLTWAELTHPDDLDADIVLFNQVIAGKLDRYELEKRFIRKDGSIVNTHLNLCCQRNADGTVSHFLVSILDVTDQRRAEELQRESDARYKMLADNSFDVIWTMDLTGKFMYVSPSVVQLRGFTPEEVMQQSFEEIISPLSQKIVMEKLQRQFSIAHDGKQMPPEAVEVEQPCKNGGTVWTEVVTRIMYDETGKSAGIIGISRNIEKRKFAQQQLALEKERLAVSLRSIGDGVITTDVQGAIVMLNKAAEEMTGWKSEAAAGRSLPEVFTIISELTREPCDNPVEKVLSTGNIIELADHTILISKNGREILIADSGAPIRDNASRITGVVLVFRDMTEKQKLNDSMQRTQKLESLGILAGGIAHDFNNMLAGIFGYLEMSKDAVAVGKFDQVPRYLNKALSVFDRAKGLTQQLLTFAKGGSPVRKTMKIAPLIQHSVNFALSGSNVTCQYILADDVWMCDCDENQIGQVVDNIVINAKQAMPLGGKIAVTVDNAADQPGHPGNFVRISIQDQGIGMPAEIISRIFDPFFSTKEAGHGLGLATVYSIIKRHDGWIDVESKQGKGSTFDFFIPASEKSVSLGAGHYAVKHKGSGTILVMDDEEFMQEIAGGMLQEMGYTVELAKDGEEALALFTQAEKSGRSFTASILDLTIPGGIGGKETAAAIRKINPKTLIIASSGYSEDPVMANPTQHGFTDRIIKPYRKKELTELMMRITAL